MGDTTGMYFSMKAAKEAMEQDDTVSAAYEAWATLKYCQNGEPYGLASSLFDNEWQAQKIYDECKEKLGYAPLSKSTYILGCQCDKALWLHKYKYDEQMVSEATQAIFKRGHIIGELAQHLFPNGVDATPGDNEKIWVDGCTYRMPYWIHQARWIQKTRTYADEGKDVYEAAFRHDRMFAAVDILSSKDGGLTAYEVKSSFALSDTYLKDAAYQYWVISHNVKLEDFVMVILNKDYVDELGLELSDLTLENCDIERLFVRISVLDRILAMQEETEKKIGECLKVIDGEEPSIAMGEQCSTPYECAFCNYCKYGPQFARFP